MMKSTSILVVLCCTHFALTIAQGQEKDEPPTRKDSTPSANLKEDLLEGLSLDALRNAQKESNNNAREAIRPAENSLDSPGGEDVGRAPRDHRLALIGQQMKDIQTRMQAQDTSRGTLAMQENVTAQLDRMIDQLQRQQGRSNEEQQNQGHEGGEQKSQQSDAQKNTDKKTSSSNPQASRQGGKTGEKTLNSQAIQSDDRVDSSEASRYAGQRPEALMKEVWGHLPERIRPKLPTSARIEKFLPKYERLIADYYERLAREER